MLAKTGWFIIGILCLVPVVLWYNPGGFDYRFSNLSMITTSMGQLTGLIGLILFSVSLLLSMRHPRFEPWFGGMNNVYIAHHQAGGLAFLLLMLHPLLLAYSYLEISTASALQFFLPSDDWTINLGIAGLLLLMALLIITYYADLPYQLWRYTHKFLGVAMFLGALHGLMVESDTTRNPVLWWYMVSIGAMGLLGYLYRTVLGRWLVPRIPYLIEKNTTLGSGIVELHLMPTTERRITFYPGQFIFITFGGSGNNETHPFSISSAPSDNGMRLTVKALGDYTKKLHTLPVQSPVWLEGPYGRFSPVYHKQTAYIWIGGGIGITPFVSMARALWGQHVSVDLYYAVRDLEEAVYAQELQNLIGKNTHFRLIVWASKTNGRLTGKALAETSPDFLSRDIYLCGPPSMMAGMKRQLKKLGVKASRLHSEEFAML